MKALARVICLLVAWWAATTSCTNSQLYAPGYQPNEASLTGIAGDLCTDDPTSSAFPLKIAVVVDGGLAGQLDDRVSALKSLVNQYSGSTIDFDIILMGQSAQSLTQGFTNDAATIQNAIQAAGSNVSPLRDYEAGILAATTDIESDALGTSPGLRSRTHYALQFVAQGPPTPDLPSLWCGSNQLTPGTSACTAQFDANFCPNQTPPPADCGLDLYTTLTTELASFLETNGALDFIGQILSTRHRRANPDASHEHELGGMNVAVASPAAASSSRGFDDRSGVGSLAPPPGGRACSCAAVPDRMAPTHTVALPMAVDFGEQRGRPSHAYLRKVVQPALLGLMDGSMSTLAPLFATAFATRTPRMVLLVGSAAAVGAAISMGFAEALSDTGTLTGRGHPVAAG